MVAMAKLRIILGLLVSIGLTLAPLQATAMSFRELPAALAEAAAMAPVDASVTARASPAQDCPCCNLPARCPIARCAVHCVQFAPTTAAPDYNALVGHPAFAGLGCPLPEGLSWQPPPPPPRS